MWIEIIFLFIITHLLNVTPLAGVWIEISVSLKPLYGIEVTPLAGVWIEIRIVSATRIADTGHSPRGSVD